MRGTRIVKTLSSFILPTRYHRCLYDLICRHLTPISRCVPGLASGAGEVAATPRLTSVTPSEGSRRGGTVITLRGKRLPHAAAGWQDAAITAGGASCRVINSTSAAASCQLEGDVVRVIGSHTRRRLLSSLFRLQPRSDQNRIKSAFVFKRDFAV